MVMVHLGVDCDEATLRDCCQTSWLGTAFREAALCARSYGLTVSEITDATWADLLDWSASGVYPIISINLFPLVTRWAAHAVVVESADEHEVTYLDPLAGRRTAARVAFEQAWQMRKGKALLIEN